MSKIKNLGEVFTPKNVVDTMLDLVDYKGVDILNKKIIDNSCGEGAFLVSALERYCDAYLESGEDIEGLKDSVENSIYGVDINEDNTKATIKNLLEVFNRYSKDVPEFKIYNFNLLGFNPVNLEGEFDYVVGNPPYVRKHNLDDISLKYAKSTKFFNRGMVDLYLLFYEKGLSLLNDTGKLIYINPSSFDTSKSAFKFREYLVSQNKLDKVYNLKGAQLFEGLTTYTNIYCINNSKTDTLVDIVTMKGDDLKNYNVNSRELNKVYLNGNFNLNEISEDVLKIIKYKTNKPRVSVKNGAASLLDDFFFMVDEGIKKENLVRVTKASTLEKGYAIKPYNNFSESVFKKDLENDKALSSYFISNETRLNNRSLANRTRWFDYGRSQSLKDLDKDRISFSNLIKRGDNESYKVKLSRILPGEIVYSGFYLYALVEVEGLYNLMSDAVSSNLFIDYIESLGKFKSDGYFTFSSKDLEKFLNYYLDVMLGELNETI